MPWGFCHMRRIRCFSGYEPGHPMRGANGTRMISPTNGALRWRRPPLASVWPRASCAAGRGSRQLRLPQPSQGASFPRNGQTRIGLAGIAAHKRSPGSGFEPGHKTIRGIVLPADGVIPARGPQLFSRGFEPDCAIGPRHQPNGHGARPHRRPSPDLALQPASRCAGALVAALPVQRPDLWRPPRLAPWALGLSHGAQGVGP